MVKLMFCAFVIQFVLLQNVMGQSGGISSKLDFGSESSTSDYESTLSTSLVKALVSLRQSSGSSPSKSIISSKLDESPFNLHSVARSTQPKADFSTLGVICMDGKCNTTEQNKNQNPGDKLSTDILVQVVTNLKDDNKSKIADDDNDVPIVVGYSGTNVKNSDFDLTNRRIDDSDVKIQTGTAGKNDERTFYHIGNEVRPDLHQHEVPYFNPHFNNHYFGEMPPPQFVWYRRRNNGYPGQNPNMYRPNNRPYKPWHWQLKYGSPAGGAAAAAAPASAVTPAGWTTTTQCSCSNPGLKWYPSFGPHQPTPSSPVNDKIAPLN